METFSETLAFDPIVVDRGERHEETSYRSGGDYRDRGSCHAHDGGRALEGLVAYFIEKKGWSVDQLLQTRLTEDEATTIMCADENR
jgi:hypothetical protein